MQALARQPMGAASNAPGAWLRSTAPTPLQTRAVGQSMLRVERVGVCALAHRLGSAPWIGRAQAVAPAAAAARKQRDAGCSQ